LQAKFAERAV